MEVALSWTAGSIERAATGGRPEREVDRDLQRIIDAWPYLSAASRAMLAALAERERI